MNFKRISYREQEALQLIAGEYTIKEIAGLLLISTHTAVSHRKNMMKKLGARNTAGLVRADFEKGMLKLPLRSAIQND